MTHRDGPIEVEVKFLLSDVEDMRRRIADTSAVKRGRVFETNIRFDDDSDNLAVNSSLLRLRQDDRNTLTFKTKPPKEDPQFKIHNEYEVIVSDFDMMGIILEKLGFVRRQIYEKWRETFILNATNLCIDSMPYGDFIEIEGTKTAIIAVTSRLGLVWDHRILLNYLEMFNIIKKHFSLSFDDVTFDNFASVSHDFQPLIQKMRVRQSL